MKSHFNLFFLFCVSFLFVFSACKKEPGCMDPAAFNYNPDAKKDDGSCIPVVLGCMDDLAMNYTSLANSSDESCLFAHAVAQGIWNIDPDCEDIEIVPGQPISLNDQLPESIEVQARSGNNALFIEIDGVQVSGEIDPNGDITVPSQQIQIDPGLGPVDVDVEGQGKIESESAGYIDLTYSGSLFTFPFSTTCNIQLSK